MINIAIMGFGVVGSGVAETILTNSEKITAHLGGNTINIKYILDLREFPEHVLSDRVVHDVNTILEDDEVSIVVETMGGENPAFKFSESALLKGKSVITSNKEVVALHGAYLSRLAKENGVTYMFEASVGGGIPIIRPLWQCLAANEIESISGILNGTCNYILTKMKNDKLDFATALSNAQKLGYAERDPSADIEGKDTCRKIAILSSLAFGKTITPDMIHCEGITEITYDDLEYADSLGCSVKLLGRAQKTDDGKVVIITAPFFVPKSDLLGDVNDVYNGVSVVGNIVGNVFFSGRGAGSLPTASAVAADVIDAARDCKKNMCWSEEKSDFLESTSDNVTRAYVRTKATVDSIKSFFVDADITENGTYKMFVTPPITESDLEKRLSGLDNEYVRIRLL